MFDILAKGKIKAIIEKKYEDNKTVYCQFLKESEDLGFEIFKVKMTKEEDIALLTRGEIVTIPVKISAVNGNLYFSQVGSMIKDQIKRA